MAAKILAVDDSRLLLAQHTEIIAALGEYEILTARNGKTAIELVTRHADIAMILLDLNMPVLDGFGFLEWLRAQPPPYRDIPVVAVTSLDSQGTLKACKLGARTYIDKPLTTDELEAVLAAFAEQPPNPARA